MGDYRIISADNHVFEPRDLWTTRLEPKFRDRAPRIVSIEEIMVDCTQEEKSKIVCDNAIRLYHLE